MDLTGILITGVLVYAITRLLMHDKVSRDQKFYLLLTSAVFYTIASLSWAQQFFEISLETELFISSVGSWMQLIGVSFGLCFLALLNWEDRPPVARYPVQFVYAPLLLIISFLFVHDTILMKMRLLGFYEIGALVIAVIFFGLLTVKNFGFVYLLSGVLVLLLSLIVYWFPGDFAETNPWIWQLIILPAVLLITHGYIYCADELGELKKQ